MNDLRSVTTKHTIYTKMAQSFRALVGFVYFVVTL